MAPAQGGEEDREMGLSIIYTTDNAEQLSSPLRTTRARTHTHRHGMTSEGTTSSTIA